MDAEKSAKENIGYGWKDRAKTVYPLLIPSGTINILGKQEYAGNQHFSPFSTMSSTLQRKKEVLRHIYLSSANAFQVLKFFRLVKDRID